MADFDSTGERDRRATNAALLVYAGVFCIVLGFGAIRAALDEAEEEAAAAVDQADDANRARFRERERYRRCR